MPKKPIFKKKCFACDKAIAYIDYQDTDMLKRFLSPYAKINIRRRTGLCAKHQRDAATAIKRARFMALMPYVPH